MLKIVGLFLGVGGLFLVFGQGLIAHYGAPAARPATANAASAVAPVPASGPRVVSLSADESGHFQVDIRLNGKFVKGLVDTGATIIALPLEEARKIGINPAQSAYTAPIRTANGQTHGARVRLSEVRIGPISVPDVEAIVVPKGLDVTLVGMSFFSRLQKFEMSGRMLVLRQ